MEKSQKIAAIILGAAAALAVYKFYQMSKEERDELIAKIKKQTEELLEDADNTVEKVQHYFSQISEKDPDQWFDKFYLLRQMVNEFYTGPKSGTGSIQPRHA